MDHLVNYSCGMQGKQNDKLTYPPRAFIKCSYGGVSKVPEGCPQQTEESTLLNMSFGETGGLGGTAEICDDA